MSFSSQIAATGQAYTPELCLFFGLPANDPVEDASESDVGSNVSESESDDVSSECSFVSSLRPRQGQICNAPVRVSDGPHYCSKHQLQPTCVYLDQGMICNRPVVIHPEPRYCYKHQPQPTPSHTIKQCISEKTGYIRQHIQGARSAISPTKVYSKAQRRASNRINQPKVIRSKQRYVAMVRK